MLPRHRLPARLATVAAVALLALSVVACSRETGGPFAREAPLRCEEPAGELLVAPPPAPCDPALEDRAGLLVLAPHPDDEVLGFAGLIDAYRRQGKPVEVVVLTDGDAYCEACRFWKSGSVEGPPCSAAELSNLATPALDSFAEVRREESRSGLSILGAAEPVFLGYRDGGLRVSWNAIGLGDPGRALRRSDFSGCASCETCREGYGAGPASGHTAGSLVAELAARLAAAPAGTLVATTHWLDRHGDHAALGNFVKTRNDELERPLSVAYAVIHAHTDSGLPLPECWYPGPAAVQCRCAEPRCAEAEPGWLARLRDHRYRPGWSAELPADAPYGEARQLCLDEEMYSGSDPLKLAAIEAHATQLGTVTRSGQPPSHLRGIVDCSGYLTAFVRSSEAFVLVEPGGEPAPCEPAGEWQGARVATTAQGRPAWAPARLVVAAGESDAVSARLTWAETDRGERTLELAGRADEGCALTLAGGVGGSLRISARIAADRRSLYGSWTEPAPGFLAVHR